MSNTNRTVPAKRRINSHDVARHAGVSQSAVSLVLSGRQNTRISDETRRRIVDAARHLNYSPNSAARALVTGKTQRISIVPNHPNSFGNRGMYYGTVLAGVMSGALECSYNLLMHSAQQPDWQSLRREILNGAADGVLLVGQYANEELTSSLLDAKFPTVCVSFQPDHPDYYSVDCDNVEGGRLAVQHLISLGHRQIAFFYSNQNSWSEDRLAGATAAMHEANLGGNVLVVAEEGFLPWGQHQFAAQTIERLLGTRPRITAVICVDEVHAMVLSEALPTYNCCVPQDMAIVGFNSTDISARARPPLTSVYQPLEEIGRAGVHMLVELIEGREVMPGTKRFPVRLDIRDSSSAVTCFLD